MSIPLTSCSIASAGLRMCITDLSCPSEERQAPLREQQRLDLYSHGRCPRPLIDTVRVTDRAENIPQESTHARRQYRVSCKTSPDIRLRSSAEAGELPGTSLHTSYASYLPS